MSAKSQNDANPNEKDQPSIVYKLMTSGDYDEVSKLLLESYFLREPLSMGINLVGEDNLEWLRLALPQWLEGGVSLVARDKDTGDMVGCMVSKILTKEDSATFDMGDKITNLKAKKLLGITRELEQAVDLFQHYSTEKGLELAMNIVLPKYGSRGIGARFVKESERLAIAKGCQFSVAQATSNYSQRYFEKLGYETLYEMKYEGYLYKGEPLDTARMTPHTLAKVVAKRLDAKKD